MGQVVTTELVGCAWEILWEDAPDVDPADGKPRFGANGQPKTKRVAIIRLADQDPAEGGLPRFWRIVFDDEQRRRLVEKLNGGISIHAPGEIPH